MKVFGIGLSKTGTSSLNEALCTIGFETIHNPSSALGFDADSKLQLDMSLIEKIDGITDVEAAYFFRELDEKFPGSRFILTTRNTESWLNSCRNHFHREMTPTEEEARLLTELYGSKLFDDVVFRRAYTRHLSEVSEYFFNRKTDLLIIDLADENKLESICNFLERPMPEGEYPRANVAVPLPRPVKNVLRKSALLVKIKNRIWK